MEESNTKCRLDKWKKPVYLCTVLSGEGEALDKLSESQLEASKVGFDGKPRFTNSGMVGACKELIFDVINGVPIFHAIMYTIDSDKILIKAEHMLDILVGENQALEEVDEDVRSTLALAMAQDIPVFPNTKEVASLLAKYHRSMLVKGFTAPDESGKRIRLMLTRSPKEKIDSHVYLQELDPTEFYSPADIALIRESVSREMNRLDRAKKTLESLELGIAELAQLLNIQSRNENELQACLTRNPIIFGAEYIRIIPKHKLGSEYEMDYALESLSGTYDLVEIESSSLPIFTKSGNPSHQLIHAEQQIIDWLNWVERNNPYARENLPGLISPVGYVVIGRSDLLDSSQKEKLRRRNAIFRGQIVLMTYDNLLVKARNLLRRLEGIWPE
jgi:hypothetical protein